VIGGLPRQNARTVEEFDSWLVDISRARSALAEAEPGARIGRVAVDLSSRGRPEELVADLEVCRRYGVQIIVSAMGHPGELAARVHDWGWGDLSRHHGRPLRREGDRRRGWTA
jgi:nitronate monooxygenase